MTEIVKLRTLTAKSDGVEAFWFGEKATGRLTHTCGAVLVHIEMLKVQSLFNKYLLHFFRIVKMGNKYHPEDLLRCYRTVRS